MGSYNPKRCEALRRALNVSTIELATDIYVLYTRRHPERNLDGTDAFVETGAIRSVIEDFEKSVNVCDIYEVMTRIANHEYEVLDNIVPVLFDIRRKKVKEYGEWYADFVLMSYKLNMVHLNEYDAKKQKDSYESLRSWLKHNDLKPWERVIHDALGGMSLFSGGDEDA